MFSTDRAVSTIHRNDARESRDRQGTYFTSYRVPSELSLVDRRVSLLVYVYVSRKMVTAIADETATLEDIRAS